MQTRARPPQPTGSAPIDLLSIDAPQALTAIADWLNDCDTVLSAPRASGRARALPMPPFNLLDAFVCVQLAADTLAASLPSHPVHFREVAEVMSDLATQEWFPKQERAA